MYSIQSPGAGRMEQSEAGEAEGEGSPLTFVYLHGFGGVKESPEFCSNLREFIAEEKAPAKVINYQWDSVKVDVMKAGASWLRAQEKADAEAPRFKREVIDRLEREGEAYVLVGYSVGSRVVLRALELAGGELGHLRGVYFLGSAMTKDTTLENRKALPEGMKITNYHSPHRDIVHRVAFNFMSDTPGGGQVGFDDTAVFDNYQVSCSHAHKGVGVATDYSGLAEGIAFLELYEAGRVIEGRTKWNLETRVMEGSAWWNKLKTLRFKGDGGAGVEIDLEQHTMRPGYYRALQVGADGERSRVARGENLHAILAEIGVRPGAHE